MTRVAWLTCLGVGVLSLHAYIPLSRYLEFPHWIRIHFGRVKSNMQVKASKASQKAIFEVSHREWMFAQQQGEKYHIYRYVSSTCAFAIDTNHPHIRQSN